MSTWIKTKAQRTTQKAAYPLGLLELICEFFHHLRVFLSHLVNLGFVISVLIFHGSFQRSYFLLTFGPGY